MMELSTISFYSLSTSLPVKQDYAGHLSVISLAADKYPEGVTFVGVTVNGMPQWTVPMTPTSVAVRPPLLQQGERVEVRIHWARSTPKPLERVSPAHPSPDLSYGLQAPEPRRT